MLVVWAAQSVIADHHGIDRPYGCRTRRQFVEQVDNGFLVRKSHVHAGKAKASHAIQQRAQLLAARARNLDQMIVAADTQCTGSLLMHRRRRGMRNRSSDCAFRVACDA